jgi:hypothetical protein
MRQETTKKEDDRRMAFRAVGTSLTTRAAAIGRKMHIRVGPEQEGQQRSAGSSTSIV